MQSTWIRRVLHLSLLAFVAHVRPLTWYKDSSLSGPILAENLARQAALQPILCKLWQDKGCLMNLLSVVSATGQSPLRSAQLPHHHPLLRWNSAMMHTKTCTQ